MKLFYKNKPNIPTAYRLRKAQIKTKKISDLDISGIENLSIELVSYFKRKYFGGSWYMILSMINAVCKQLSWLQSWLTESLQYLITIVITLQTNCSIDLYGPISGKMNMEKIFKYW